MVAGPTSETRRERLRDLVQSRGFASLGELAESLEVSESTIRRDLEQLERDGVVRRTHGGAFWTGEPDTMRIFETRRDDSWPAKAAIGAMAAALVEDHDTILLDGGSTTYELARHLVGRPLQVVTNSLPVAHLLVQQRVDRLGDDRRLRSRPNGGGDRPDGRLDAAQHQRRQGVSVGRRDHRPWLLQQQHDAGRERKSDVGFGRSGDRGGRQQQVWKSQFEPVVRIA